MKAKIKQTGEIVDVEPYFYAKINSTDPMMHKNDIELIEPNADIDYEQRRYEIAKAMLAAFMSNSDKNVFAYPKANQAKEAVDFADALIAELKKRE